MKRTPTLTIGISALNEEQNIICLLNALLSQKNGHYLLSELVVISDGSTDQTVPLVKSIQNKYPVITLIDGKKR
ncbi:glycosyltransferase, partial [Candidatus Roizmanbacteria bacterium]|nr:glycosyltransferase [Candidatus Roizmanbacteria bacterium]